MHISPLNLIVHDRIRFNADTSATQNFFYNLAVGIFLTVPFNKSISFVELK